MRIRHYEDGDAAAILELLRLALGENSVTPRVNAYWEWKHDLNPFGRSLRLLATDESGLVGLRAFMRWNFLGPDGKFVRAVRAVDTATHPNHRRKGLFSRLTRQALEEAAAEGVGFVFNTPNEKSLPGYLKLGWEVVCRWPVYVKPLKPLRFVLGVVRSRLGLSAPAGTFIPEPPLKAWEGQDAPEPRTTFGLRTPRDRAYLEWRYGRHPTVRYFTFENDGGMAVLRPNLRFGLREIVLVELFPGDPERLIQGLVEEVQGDYLIAHFAETSPELEMLKQAGFGRAPGQGMIFTTRILDEGLALARQAGSWDLSLGDLELF